MLCNFSKEFLARVPVRKLEWKIVEDCLKESKNLNELNDADNNNVLDCQERVLQATLFHPLNLKFPLPDNYIHSFLKKLISQIEESECEIHPDLLEKYATLLSQQSLDQSSSAYRTFLINETLSISLKENTSIISDGTTGLCTWQAAFYLAEWCLHHQARLAGRRIVELGSGAGLVGLTCYKLCHPRCITMTDFHPKVLETLACNLKSNVPETLPSSPTLEIQPLDWVEFSQNENCLQADIVLASDVVYDVDLIPSLVGTLSKLLRSSDSTAIVACTERNPETLNRFLSEIGIHHLTYQQLDHAPAVFACERTYPVHIYEIARSIQSFDDRY